MKSCICCGIELTDATWAPDQQQNYVNKCRECIKAEKREYHKEWRKKHPEKARETQRRHKEKLRTDDPVRARAQAAYGDCRKRAMNNGMEFDLTQDVLLQMMREAVVCPYLGVAITFEQGTKSNSLASVDRIDSSRGYTRDNVQIISYLANLMKSHATDVELLKFAEGVLSIHGLRTVAVEAKQRSV